MPSIFPNAIAGGLQVRDAFGVCLTPAGVVNAYCPPAAFQTTCAITALPSDCTARIEPAQINAIVSEMLCFATMLNPEGTWNCGSTCNLSSLFASWMAGDYEGSLGSFMDAQLCNSPVAALDIDESMVLFCNGDGEIQQAPLSEFATMFEITYAKQPTAPAPSPGRMWHNTSATAVGGVSGDGLAVWDETAWLPITYGGFTIGFDSATLADGVEEELVISTFLQQGGPNEVVLQNIGGTHVIATEGDYFLSGAIRFLAQLASGLNQSANIVAHINVNNIQVGPVGQIALSIPSGAGNANSTSVPIPPFMHHLAAGDQVSLTAIVAVSTPANIVSLTTTSLGTWLSLDKKGI